MIAPEFLDLDEILEIHALRADGIGVQLGYFSIGDGVPENASKSEDVQALALEISGRF